MKSSKLPTEWKDYSANHERFVASRKISLQFHSKPEDAFTIGVKGLRRNANVSENMLKEIKNIGALVRMSLKVHFVGKLTASKLFLLICFGQAR